MLLTKVVPITTLLGMLVGLSWTMDLTMQEKALTAYRSWFPRNPAVHFQDGFHNHLLLQHLRDNVNSMRIIEVGSSTTHRHFVVPLHLRGLHSHFDMRYSSKKNYFAAFRLPLDPPTYVAHFNGIGAINGIVVKQAREKFATTIPTQSTGHYGLFLHVPE